MLQAALTIAKALSDEHRIRILMCLEGTPLCLGHLAEIFQLSQSNVSRHLQTLLDAGLIKSWQVGRWRYFRWEEHSDNPIVRYALEWVRHSLKNDPRVVSDLTKLPLALETIQAPLPSAQKPRVLFLCLKNSCRSQMAEGILRKHAGERLEIYSAGLQPRDISPLTVEAMEEIGIDIRMQHSTDVMTYLGKMYFDYLITVCAETESRSPVFPGVRQRLHWPVPDPADAKGNKRQKMTIFREVRDELEDKILKWLDQLHV